MTPTLKLRDVLAELLNSGEPLAEKLEAYAAKLRVMNAPFAAAYDELISRLRAGNVGAGAPDIGDEWPAFLLPDQNGKLARSEQLTAAGPLVVSLNRGHWCPFCKIELRTYADKMRQIDATGAQFVAILPDRQEYFPGLLAQSGPSLRLLTDMDLGYTLSLGLAFGVGDRLANMMSALGLRLDRFHGNGAWLLPVPATFVVGRDNKVKARFVDPDFRRRMAIEDVLRVLRAEAAGPPATRHSP